MRTDGGALYTQIEQQLPSFIQHNHSKFSKFVEKYYEFLELNLVTFNDLNLNEDKPIQESDNVTYTVTVATGNNAYSNSVNKFFVGGSVSPILNVSTGITYIFDQSNSTNEGHPLRISTTPNGRHTPGGDEYSNGVNVIAYGTPGSSGAQTSIYISPDVAGTELYYYCNTHSGMGGNVVIANTTPYISLENGNTDSSNTNNTYIDLENPNRQGDQFLSGETVEGANSGATGIVRGKYSTTQAYIEETNNGNFQVGERIVGQESRVSANVTAYHRQALNASRNVKSFQDVDKAPLGFVELLRKEFLQGVPKGALGSKANMLKHIKDFYRAKGNEASFQFIFRLLYGKENVTFYYPSTDIMRLSDGRWTQNKSLKIDFDQANNFSSFEGRFVRGSISNVVALIERTETYQVGSTTISELYLSNIDANNASYNANTDSGFTSFLPSDTITTTTTDDDGNYATAPLTGILASVAIDAGGSNYSVGDDIAISGGGGGREAGVKVASVSDATISSFDIIDPGDGFSVGDAVTFTNEGTGGTGGSARVQTITPTANIFVDTLTINPHKEDLLSASAFTAPLQSITVNTHVFSNSTTTFSAGLTGTAPKKGDLLFELSISQLLAEDGDTLTTETGGGVRRFDIESIADDINYNANTAKFGTVVSVDTDTTPNTVIYALGSIVIDTVTGTRTIRNFENGETVFVYDTQRDGTGSPASANGHNAVLSDTGANVVFANTPAAVTSNTYFGALAGTVNEAQVGGIRSLQVLSSGQGYTSIPVVEIANTKIESFGNAPDKVGANSVFVTLASAIANQFTSNTIVKNQSNSASGLVLGPITSNTSLVATGNTVLRVQMTTSNNFSASDTLTAYTNNADENPVGIGDFGSANIATSSATGTFTQNAHGFSVGQRIVISGSVSGTDATLYNNNHTIASVTNSSTYTVTFPSSPTDTSESNLKVRRVVSANVAGSNSVFANTGAAGNNASIAISSIAIGAIQSVSIYNFGANYTSAPNLDASGIGGGDATLTASLGALAEYDGFFDGAQGLLSGQTRMQDNYYYQDFSYVIKTDIDTASYRDQILNLVHPSGLKMFGEVVMYLNATAGFMNSAANTINDIQANTALTGGSVNVPNYRLHELTIANQNTASSNVQISVQASLFRPAVVSPPIDARVEFPHLNFDLVLEQSNAGVALESAGDVIGLEADADAPLFSFVKASASLASQDNDARDVKFNNDGTKMFMLGRGNDGVYEYSLSKAFDISTLTFVRELDIGPDVAADSGRETAANSIEFNLDGTKLFVLGQSDDDVNEWALSTGFDLSTASFTDSFDINTQEGQPYGLAFNNDGTKMYVTGWQGDDVNQYTLTTAFDVSTAVYTQKFSTEGTGRSNPSAVQFNADGTFMYVLQGDTTPRIQEYSLTIAFDISTASFTEKVFDLTNQENRARGFCFSNDHSRLFVTGWRGDDINEYVVNTDVDSLVLQDGFSKIQMEEFEDSIIQENGSNIELEGDVAARNYLLSEPIVETTQIVSEDDHDVFNIRLEEDGNDYLIELEGTEYEYIIGENDERILGIERSEEPLRMTLEADVVVQDEDHFIVIDRTHSDGFLMPQIQFPESETGAVQIDMGYGTQLKLEDDNYLLLEGTEGMFPLYLAMEDSMADEIIVGTQIQINPIQNTNLVQPFTVSVVDESDSTTPYDEQVWLAENGNRFVFDFLETSNASAVLENLEVNLPYGTGRSSSFEYKAEGNLNVTMGELFELLTEDGDKYVEESVPDDLANLTDESGNIFLLEHSYLSNKQFAINKASDTVAEMRNLIGEVYDRKPSITGTGTNFDSDFNAPIVLEDDDQTLVTEGLDADFRLIRERSDDGIQPFGTEHSDNATTYITLETYTDDGDLILIEGDDRVFVPIELETATGNGNLELEVSESNPNRRLIYNDYLDVIIEEECVALEEDDRILMEDYVSGDPESFKTEGGDNFVLEHLNDNLATEGVTGIFHITYDLKIGDFTASVALEDNTSVVLESHTPTGIGDILLTANGDRLIREEDVGDDKFFLSETSYASTYANATITVVDDNRKTTNQTRNFITNGGDNLISEDGDSFVSEVGEDVPVTSEIEIIGDVFPHGSHEFARVVFADGDTAEIVSRTNDYLYNVDYGAILLEDNPITHATEYLLSEEGSGSKIIRNYHQSSAQNYRLEYARHNQASSINQTDRFMKTEIGTTDTNNAGREYQFTINGIKTATGALPNLHEWSEIHGDNIVMEDGANILTEDGEVGQDPNAILLEFENVLMSENTIIDEAILDEDGGNIVLEDESDDSEYLTYEENEHLELESFGYNYKLLNMEGGKYRIDYVANNTFMKLDQETDLFTNAPFRVNHLERVPS